MICEARVVENQLPHTHRRDKAKPYPGNGYSVTGEYDLCRRNRRAQRGYVRRNGKAMAQCSPRPERQHTRLRHNQRAYLPVEYGKPQCGFHRTRHDAEREACEAEPNRYPSDGRIGKWRQR